MLMTHEVPDYAMLDSILSIAEGPIRSVIREHQLTRASVERWRWDEPEITLTWLDTTQGYISKNVRFMIEPIEAGKFYYGPPYVFATEANAWLDEDSETGESRTRRWQHEKVVEVKEVRNLEHASGEISEAIWRTYEVAARWDEGDLTRIHYLRDGSPPADRIVQELEVSPYELLRRSHVEEAHGGNGSLVLVRVLAKSQGPQR